MPVLTIKSECQCGKLKPSSARWCDDCKVSGKAAKKWAEATQFTVKKFGSNPYGSVRWKKTRAQAIRRDKGLCVKCLSRGEYTPFTDVDHITPVSMGGDFFRLDNLQCLCTKCHRQKTKEE